MSKRHPDFDYEAEGLLADVHGEDGRDARIRLLDYLIDEESVEPEELLLAHEEQRLFLLPVERALGGVPRYNAAEVAEQAGVDLELFLELRKSLGLADPDVEQRSYSDFDVKTMKSVRANLEMGMSVESIREINRVLGASLSQLAAVVERQFLATYLDPTLDEAEMAKRYAAITRATTPEFAFVLQHLFNLHLRDQMRADILGSEQSIDFSRTRVRSRSASRTSSASRRSGSRSPPKSSARSPSASARSPSELVEPPVRLIKSIGDAVMLIAPEPRILLDTALLLMQAVEREPADFPQLSVGLAYGEALDRAGDVYGPPVNLASRLSDVARPGSVLTTAKLQEDFPDDYDWSNVGRRRFKGISEPVSIFRARELGTRAESKQRS